AWGSYGRERVSMSIASLESPTQGRITLDGQCMSNVSPSRCTLAMVFEFFHPTTKTDASKRLWQAFSLKGPTLLSTLVSCGNCGHPPGPMSVRRFLKNHWTWGAPC